MDIGVVIKKYRKEAGMAQQLLVVGKFAPYCFFSQILRMPWKKSKQDFIISGRTKSLKIMSDIYEWQKCIRRGLPIYPSSSIISIM